MAQNEKKYFDLHIQGIGYLNRVREVKPERSDPFWATDIAAIFGSADSVQKTRFDCRVVGTEAQAVIARAKKHVDDDRKVLVAFKLGDLYADTFTYAKGDKAGTTGVSLKARLLRIDWVKVDGQTVYTAPTPESTAVSDDSLVEQSQAPSASGVETVSESGNSEELADYLPAEVQLAPDDPDFEQKKARLKAQGYRFDSNINKWKLPEAA